MLDLAAISARIASRNFRFEGGGSVAYSSAASIATARSLTSLASASGA